jgi:hypothetical protein
VQWNGEETEGRHALKAQEVEAMFCAWNGHKAKPSAESSRFSGKSGGGYGNFALGRLLLGLIAVLALGLASCGGGGGDAHTSSAPPDITETPSALPDVSGTWSGSLFLNASLSGNWCADISQSGETLTADMLIRREVTGPTISLKVTNLEGEPLPGASVWVPFIASMPDNLFMDFPAEGKVLEDERIELTGSGTEDIRLSGTLAGSADAVTGEYVLGSNNEEGTWEGKKTNETCRKCDLPPEPFTAYACTDEKGEATLQLPEGVPATVVVKVDSGLCSVQADIEINDREQTIPIVCGTNKKIAVATGMFDKTEYLLDKSGLRNSVTGDVYYKLYDGVNADANWVAWKGGYVDSVLDDSFYPNFPALFNVGDTGQKRMFDYDVVFINCGNLYGLPYVYRDPTLPDRDQYDLPTDWTSTLEDYVSQRGGRLVVSDQSYDFLEQTFPEYIDFAGSDGTPETEPEAWNVAQIGQAGDRVATVMDEGLVQWLKTVTCVDSTGAPMLSCINANDNTITVTGFLYRWAVMDGLHEATRDQSKEWLVDSEGKPLLVTISVGNGRILFSSYHAEEDIKTREGFTPQERVLQYVMFAL